MGGEAQEMEDKARRAMLDAAKLADELRVEQENAQGLERDRKDLENRAHELQINLDEAEANAIKWGRKMVAKLESRAKDIEAELDGEQRRLGDKLQQQVRTYKRQIEEAEEIAALNLAKFRKAQVDMQESLERADISEQALAKSRVRGRSMSLARDL